MEFQAIIILFLFVLAAIYLSKMVFDNIRPEKGRSCGSNCKCGMDFSNISTKKP